jgi:hypothetical protein
VDYTFAVAFGIGLVSTLHCLGMCSGIIGALTFSLPQPVYSNRRRLSPFVVAYNAGRVASYTVAGALVGSVSATLVNVIDPDFGHRFLQWFAALVLLAMGSYLAGWFPGFAVLERFGKPIWQRLEPLGRRLLPVKTLPQAFLFGAVWGWLPCGLVYSMLLWSMGSGGAMSSALQMLAFGLGTLPAVLVTGILAGWMARLGRASNIRRGAGVVIVIVAVVVMLTSLEPAPQQHLHAGSGGWVK